MTLETCVAGVLGIPYNDCKHEGVMVLLHDAGTSRVLRSARALCAGVGETNGFPLGGSMNLMKRRDVSSCRSVTRLEHVRNGRVHELDVIPQIKRNGIRQCSDKIRARTFVCIKREVRAKHFVGFSDGNGEAEPLAVAGQVCSGDTVLAQPGSYSRVALVGGRAEDICLTIRLVEHMQGCSRDNAPLP